MAEGNAAPHFVSEENVPMVATESSCELPAPTYAPTEESGTFVLAEGPFAYSEMKRFIREAIDEKFDQFEKGTLKPYCEKMKTAGTENSMENLYEVLQTQLRAVTKDLSDNLCATIRQQLSSGPHYDQPDSKSLDNKPEKGRKDSLKPHKTATKLLESATNHTRSTPTSYSASASGVDGTAAHIHTGTLPDGSYEGLGSEPTSEEVHSKIDHLAGQEGMLEPPVRNQENRDIQIKHLKEEKNTLQKKLREQEDKLIRCQQDLRDKCECVDRQNVFVIKQENEVKIKKGEITTLKEENEELRVDIKQKDNEIANLKCQLAACSSQNKGEYFKGKAEADQANLQQMYGIFKDITMTRRLPQEADNITT